MGGAGHVGPVDLNDLITRLEAAVTGHQALREHLLNMASYCVRRLEHYGEVQVLFITQE